MDSTLIVLVAAILWVGGLSFLMYKVNRESPKHPQGRASDPSRAPWTSSAMQDSMDGGE